MMGMKYVRIVVPWIADVPYRQFSNIFAYGSRTLRCVKERNLCIQLLRIPIILFSKKICQKKNNTFSFCFNDFFTLELEINISSAKDFTKLSNFWKLSFAPLVMQLYFFILIPHISKLIQWSNCFFEIWLTFFKVFSWLFRLFLI